MFPFYNDFLNHIFKNKKTEMINDFSKEIVDLYHILNKI